MAHRSWCCAVPRNPADAYLMVRQDVRLPTDERKAVRMPRPAPHPQPTPGPTGPLTAELVVDVAAAVAPAISPDGRLVAYGVVANGGRDGRPHGSVWVTAADGSTPPRRLTDGAARDLAPKWAPDSAALLFTSDREEQGTAQLQRIRLEG